MPPSRLAAARGLVVLAAVLLAGCSLAPGVSSQRGVSEHVRIERSRDGATTVLLPVTIQGRGPYTFALDTGASRSLVSTTVAADIGLSRAGPPEPIQGLGGVTRAVPVRVTSWSTGNIKLPPMVITSADLATGRGAGGLQGLLGSDVWDAIGSFKLDYRTSTLTVNPQ
ncbi:MAG TPA: retropepsin-like aspartic protease [Gemmataceae bacterium]|nr:retropepsin-like aspartic protease [Gemmataceae bacterium]